MSPSQVFTRVGAHPGNVEHFNGLIDNAFMFDRALSEGEIERVRLNGAAEILTLAIDPSNGRLWSVDIHAVGGSVNANPTPSTKSGVEAYYTEGNVWNAFEVPGHDSNAVNPTLNNLVDSDGFVSSVNFAMSGTISGWSNASGDALYSDYAFVGAGTSDASVTWELSGLTPGHTYELMLYGGVGRVAPITVDVNGDGSILDDTMVTAPANSGLLIEGISPDGSGRIIGNFVSTAGEANWSGFQLRDTTVIPEPNTAALLLLGFSLIVARRLRVR
jgi:hypothetical protein